MAKKIIYNLGDILSLPISEKYFGYGRILIIDSPAIFVGFYKTISRDNTIDISELENNEYIMKIICGDLGIKRAEWHIVGNLPIKDKETLPYFWDTDVITKQLILRRYNPPANHPLALVNFQDKPATEIEIKEKNAQPNGSFGWKAAEIKLKKELEKVGII